MKWIKCWEKLPEKDETYLTFDGIVVEVAMFNIENKKFYHLCTGTFLYGICKSSATYWMPLPKEPDEMD